MKKIIFCTTLIVLMTVALTAAGEQKVSVEMLYMNHGPLQSTLKEIDAAFAQYKDKIIVSRYDFESPEGERFMARKGIRQHIPLMIWIDGKSNASIKGKDVVFTGFPAGSGPAFVQGKWTMDDLRNALKATTHKK